MLRLIPILTAAACAITAGSKLHANELDINIVYLEQQRERPPVLSNLVVHPEDEGEQGAILGTADNNTTGKFLKDTYTLETIIVPPEEDVVAAAQAVLEGTKLVVLNMPSDKLLQLPTCQQQPTICCLMLAALTSHSEAVTVEPTCCIPCRLVPC